MFNDPKFERGLLIGQQGAKAGATGRSRVELRARYTLMGAA